MTVLVSTHYMDEAERCHEIAYIAYGHLLAQGTVDEIIAKARPRPPPVEGGDLGVLADELKHGPAVAMVAPFRRPLACRRPRCGGAEPRWRKNTRARASGRADAPTLEDVFIDLMTRRRTITNEGRQPSAPRSNGFTPCS